MKTKLKRYFYSTECETQFGKNKTNSGICYSRANESTGKIIERIIKRYYDLGYFNVRIISFSKI